MAKARFEKVAKLYEEIQEELDGVKNYSMESQSSSEDAMAQKLYSEMAKQELQHAQNLQKILSSELEKLRASEDSGSLVNDICDYFNHSAEQSIMSVKIALPSGF